MQNASFIAEQFYDQLNPVNQPEPKECPDCQGTGTVYISCCGDDISANIGETDICPTCNEHCGDEGEDSETCKGTGFLETE